METTTFATPAEDAVTTDDQGRMRVMMDPVTETDTQAPAKDLQDAFRPMSDQDFDGDEEYERYDLAAQLREIGVEPFPQPTQSPDDMMIAGPTGASEGDDSSVLGTVGSVLETTGKAIFKGSDKSGRELMSSFAFLAGAPVEAAKNVINVGLEAVGMEPIKSAFGDIESMRSLVGAYENAVNEAIPVPDAVAEWASQPYEIETLGNIIEPITQFTVAAVPAAKLVKAMTSYNAAARGFVWGAIADFTAFNPDDPTLANQITEYLEQAPPEEQIPVLQSFLSVMEKYETDSELVKRAKMAMEGGAIGGVVEGAIKVARSIPFAQIIDASKRAIGRAGEAADARIAERAQDTGTTLTAGADPTPAIDAALSYAGRKARKSGQLVGAPPEIKSQKALDKLRRNLEEAAKEGEPGRFWYERSGKAILDALGGDKVEAEKLVQAIGISSSATGVKTNFDFALQAYLQHKAGKPVLTGRFPAAMSKKIQNVFDGIDWEGRKTNNFYVNLMREIDPSKVQGVTVDMWMMRAFGFKNADGTPYSGTPTDAQYTFVEEETKRIGDQLGWEPQQVQAAIWVANKAKDEGTTVSAAAFDYSDALLNNKAQISWESIPGRTGNHMPEMFDAPYEIQQEYHVAVSKAFLDNNGNDFVAKELGIPTPGDFEAPGYFEGKVSPGTQTELAIPREYKGPDYGSVEPAALELMQAYAAIRGIVMKQDGVGFHRPFFDPKKADANGVELRIGRKFSEAETEKLAKILSELSGHGEYNPIATRDGVRIINFDFAKLNADGTPSMPDTWLSADQLKTNKEFTKLVQNAIETIDLDDDIGVEIKLFNSQNGYAGNDWSVNKNGEDYLNDIRGEGRSDLQRQVRSIITRLQSRIDEIDIDFAERYGFTRNTELNQEFRQTD